MTKGQSDAIRALAFGYYALCANLEARGLAEGAGIARSLRCFRSEDADLMNTIEALARNVEQNPFGPAGMPTGMTVIEGGLSMAKEEEN